MTIEHRLLGKPFADNALFVKINSGQKIVRLLFDCGENTITHLPVGEIVKVDHLFFSHFHLDHVAGFDHFIRLNYNRENKPVHIWGPTGSAQKVLHRLKSLEWNLLQTLSTRWYLHEVSPSQIKHYFVRADEQFGRLHFQKSETFNQTMQIEPEFTLTVFFLDHQIVSLGFLLQEAASLKIRKEMLQKLNLPTGPWLQQLKDFSISKDTAITVEGQKFKLSFLRERLLYTLPGTKLAYLTDFLYPKSLVFNQLKNYLQHSDVLYCEAQYLAQDFLLAQKNFHLTTEQAARLAKETQVKRLILFHFSQRYKHQSPLIFKQQAQKVFKNSQLPVGWD